MLGFIFPIITSKCTTTRKTQTHQQPQTKPHDEDLNDILNYYFMTLSRHALS